MELARVYFAAFGIKVKGNAVVNNSVCVQAAEILTFIEEGEFPSDWLNPTHLWIEAMIYGK